MFIEIFTVKRDSFFYLPLDMIHNKGIEVFWGERKKYRGRGRILPKSEKVHSLSPMRFFWEFSTESLLNEKIYKLKSEYKKLHIYTLTPPPPPKKDLSNNSPSSSRTPFAILLLKHMRNMYARLCAWGGHQSTLQPIWTMRLGSCSVIGRRDSRKPVHWLITVAKVFLKVLYGGYKSFIIYIAVVIEFFMLCVNRI